MKYSTIKFRGKRGDWLVAFWGNDVCPLSQKKQRGVGLLRDHESAVNNKNSMKKFSIKSPKAEKTVAIWASAKYRILGQRRSSEGLCLCVNGGSASEISGEWSDALGGYGQGKLLDVAGIYERTGGGGICHCDAAPR